ncbi:hypothetical protein HHI36_008417 [Cryptolaemus montrouzieri]|uniref:Lipase domain-containing protein n=1 Tax=Cryptolaemus montrouzieri TaxID=559131 RepID=A0ABD2MSX2_9CUCU
MAEPSKFIVFFLVCCSCLIVPSTTKDVTFLLYNKECPKQSTKIEASKLFCHKSYSIDKFTNVFFIIHGWLHSVEEYYVNDIRHALFQSQRKKTVVIEVDWSNFARKDYIEAQKGNELVANATSDVLSCLVDDNKLPHSNIEIICHCMGCHIAGIAGKYLQICTGKKIKKITALDPAGPGYLTIKHRSRLGPNDADIVFVVHTDAFMFGYGNRCGTIDFYPNGGKHPQPGCPEKLGVIEYDLCSHQRSLHFYIESLKYSYFPGIKCPSYSDYKRGLCSSNPKVDFSKNLIENYKGTYFGSIKLRKPCLFRNRTR